MSDEKKALSDVLPEDHKDQQEAYPDHLKDPLHGIEDRKDTMEKALDKDE